MKKILLIEPDKEQAELFADWLKGESYGVSLIDKPQEAQSSLANEKFDILLMDIDPSAGSGSTLSKVEGVDEPEIAENSLKLARMLKSDARFKDLPIAVLTYRKDIKKIIAPIEAGVDIFMLQPFETDSFLKRIEDIFKEIELRSKGKKILDLNFVNYLIELVGQMEREDFFALSPVIFNKLIIEKVNTILGPLIITQIIKRVNETIGVDYEFMKSVEFSGKGLFLDGVDKASKEVPIKKITIAYRDYVYAFLHLVRSLTSNILMERTPE